MSDYTDSDSQDDPQEREEVKEYYDARTKYFSMKEDMNNMDQDRINYLMMKNALASEDHCYDKIIDNGLKWALTSILEVNPVYVKCEMYNKSFSFEGNPSSKIEVSYYIYNEDAVISSLMSLNKAVRLLEGHVVETLILTCNKTEESVDIFNEYYPNNLNNIGRSRVILTFGAKDLEGFMMGG
jgi:hypothetical protein